TARPVGDRRRRRRQRAHSLTGGERHRRRGAPGAPVDPAADRHRAPRAPAADEERRGDQHGSARLAAAPRLDARGSPLGHRHTRAAHRRAHPDAHRPRRGGAERAGARKLPRAQPERGARRETGVMTRPAASRYTVALAALAAALCGTSCMFRRSTDPTRFYVLTATVPDPASAPGSLAIGLGPVAMPGYLAHPMVATRIDGTQVRYAAYDR